jgi:arsenate reductase
VHIPFDLVFSVCDHASEQCPILPGAMKRIHYNFPDPAKATGTEEEVMNAFRSVRDEIKAYCKSLL